MSLQRREVVVGGLPSQVRRQLSPKGQEGVGVTK